MFGATALDLARGAAELTEGKLKGDLGLRGKRSVDIWFSPVDFRYHNL